MTARRSWFIWSVLWLSALTLAGMCWGEAPVSRAADALSIANVTDNRALYGDSIPRFEKLEISFDVLNSVAQNYQLPYDVAPPPGIPAGVGITVDGLFSPDDWQTVFTQPAFYYQDFDYQIKGGREWLYPTDNYSWKVRFAPDREGTWQYKLKVTDASGTIETAPVSFQVVSSPNHGFVRVSQADPRYFEYSDGTYFPGLGYNMNYDHVSWVNPVLDNQEHFQKMGQNGIQLVRIWLSQWAIFTSAWNPWNSIDPALHAQYIPYTGLTASQSYAGSEVSMQVSATGNACMFIGAWKAQPAVKRNTNYRVTIRYKTVALDGPRVAGAPYGFAAKIGGWLWHDSDETRRCYYPGTGTLVTPHQSQNTSDWELLQGSLYTGNNDFLPYFYLVLENATSGAAYVDYVWIQEEMGNGQLGPNIVSKPWMAHHLYFEQRNSYAFDKVVDLARQHGVYLRPVILEKNEWIFNRIDYAGAFTDTPSNDYFYGDYRNLTKTRWLQKAWWRYLQARWGYSTNLHSWELLNEGDPFNGRHYHLADELGATMHQFKPDDHLVSTSTWHSFPRRDFWANANYPHIDFADVHLYIPSDSDTVIRVDAYHYLVSPLADFYDSALADRNLNQLIGAGTAFWPGKPVIRGETGFIEGASWQPIPQLAADSQGIWLHNFIWAGIGSGGLLESYWYETQHIYSRKGDGTYNFDHRPHFGGYYRFIKDIPLNNGLYEDAQAQVSDPDLRAWGQKDLVHGNAHLWIANARHTWKNVVDQVPIPALSGAVTVAGFAPHTICSLEWWDTYAGNVALTSNAVTDAAGDLTLTIEDLTSDTAVKIACPLRLADVVASKQLVAAPVSPGEEMGYRISYANQGSGIAWDVTISDTLPPGVAYVADWPEEGQPGAVLTGPTVVWHRPLLLPGNGGVLTLQVALSDDVRPGQALTNVLTITTAAPEDDLSNNAMLHVALVPTTSLVPASATLLGPQTGLVNARHWFTASVTPATVALPLTYTWQASAQPPVIHTGGLSDTLSFVWDRPGTQTIRVTAANAFGSVGASATISLTDEAIAGLLAINDGPTRLGRATAFTAEISAGTNVAYNWALGDGSTERGPTITHVYTAVGRYTAAVTAANSANTLNATTVISLVDVPVADLHAVNDSPTFLGRPTAFTASTSAGTNVVYDWAFGDGGAASLPTTTYTYRSAGVYTAVVTAANSANLCVASTVVTVSVPRGKLLYVPLVLRPG